jgi:hypothetical protein
VRAPVASPLPPWLKAALRLLAGALAFDLLLNLPRLAPGALAASLLQPSVDLLVMAGVCMTGARSGGRVAARVAAGVAVIVLAACAFGERFGWDIFLRLFGVGGMAAALSVLACSAAAAAVFLAGYWAGGLTAAGFADLVVRNVFLLAAALAVVAQVLTRVSVFSPSVVPRAIRAIGALMK